MTFTIFQIDKVLDRLDPDISYRVYLTYYTGTKSVECVTREDFRMRPTHLKSLSWLLAIRNPVELSFDSDKTELVNFSLPMEVPVRPKIGRRMSKLRSLF